MRQHPRVRKALALSPLLLLVLITLACVPRLPPPVPSGPSGPAQPTPTTAPATTTPATTPPATTTPATTTPATTTPATTTPATTVPATTPPATTVPSTPTTVPSTPASLKPQAPATGALLGTWIAPRGTDWTQATQQSLMGQREAAAGRTFDISHAYYRWDLPFPTWRETWNAQNGRIPMVSWNGTNTSDIISGQYDAMIRQRAAGLRDLHTPVYLRFFWEMDGAWQLPHAESPANYIAAWRHVHQIFDAEGATNVAWVWCPNAWAFDVSLQNAVKWYPGDDVVDWICSDGYNWAPTKANSRWTSFETIFQNFYDWASTKNKPLMIGEFGAIENAPNQKAAWITAAQVTLKTKFTKIKALVYYDENRHEDNTIYDWRLDSSPATYAAWNTLAADPYFNQR